jgi:hypothetical protein
MRLHLSAIASNAIVLQCGIDRDRPHAADRIPFVQKVAANDLSIDFGRDVKEPLVPDQRGEKADRRVHGPALSENH